MGVQTDLALPKWSLVPLFLRGMLCTGAGPLADVPLHSGFFGVGCDAAFRADLVVLSVLTKAFVPFRPFVLLYTTIHDPY